MTRTEAMNQGQMVQTVPRGTPTWSRDAVGTNTKTYTVPAAKVWRVFCAGMELTASATAGNRILSIRVGNGTNQIWQALSTGNIATTQKGNSLVIFGGENTSSTTATPLYNPALTITATVRQAGPIMILPAGYTVTLLDSANIDAADTMVTAIEYIETNAGDYTIV